jgi:hypothetical protein
MPLLCYSVSETPWLYEKTVVWDLGNEMAAAAVKKIYT